MEDDNSEDIEIDFESEDENLNGNYKGEEKKKIEPSIARSNKNNGRASKDDIELKNNGQHSKQNKRTDDVGISNNIPGKSVDLNIPIAHNDSGDVQAAQKTNNFDLKTLNLEESDQFKSLKERIKELESWKEQRVKEDNAFKDTINLTFTKVLDKLVELDQNFQVLKAQQTQLQNASVLTPHRMRNGQKTFIKITATENHEIHEFPSDEEGNLSVASVNTVYPGNNNISNVH